SAIAPPNGARSAVGTNAAAATSPDQPAFPVWLVTRMPTPTVSIHVPMFDTKAPVHSRANRRCRSGASDRGGAIPATVPAGGCVVRCGGSGDSVGPQTLEPTTGAAMTGATRKIGEVEVSLAGLGCNNFGMRIDEERSFTVVDAAIDAGINHFDTADIYGGGHSEEFLGRALGSRRGDVVITSKFGMRKPPDESIAPGS